MPLVASNMGDSGLSYYGTCDCEDFIYRHEVVLEMTQVQINSRWIKARDTLSAKLTWQPEYPAWEALVAGGSETHKVHACKSTDNPGPNFMCKHIFATLRLILKEIDGFVEVIAFGRPDTALPAIGMPVSVDGWMVALVEKEKEDEN